MRNIAATTFVAKKKKAAGSHVDYLPPLGGSTQRFFCDLPRASNLLKKSTGY